MVTYLAGFFTGCGLIILTVDLTERRPLLRGVAALVSGVLMGLGVWGGWL